MLWKKGGPRAKGELPIPPIAHRDPQGIEVARIWVAEEGQHVSLRAGIWSDPMAWGLMLADFARHVANAYQQEEGRDPQAVLQRIREGLDAEWDYPTDEPSGHMAEEGN